MAIRVYFPGNKKVYAENKGFIVETDQPEKAGGDNSAPAPFDLFLTSIVTCAGIFVKGFCDARDLSAEGIELKQSLDYDPVNRRIKKIKIDIQVPEDFPKKYHAALVKAADQCSVKKTIFDPPEFEVNTVVK